MLAKYSVRFLSLMKPPSRPRIRPIILLIHENSYVDGSLWSGVGTWKTPPEIDIVSEKHLEAWKLSQENIRTGNQEAMNRAEGQATLEKMEALIQSVPIDAFLEITGAPRKTNFMSKKPGSKKQDHKLRDSEFDDDVVFSDDDMLEMLGGNFVLTDFTRRINERINTAAEQKFKDSEKDTDLRGGMRKLLLEYRKQLLEAIQFMKAKNEPISPVIEEAIAYINNQMGLRHWAGR